MCVARNVILFPQRDPTKINRAGLPPSQPLLALGGPFRVSLAVFWRYRIVSDGGQRGPWHVRIERYEYQVINGERRDVLAYHWHPDVSASVAFPHLHIRGSIVPLSHQTHLPTGMVSLGAVVRLLITEFGVPPLRNDWQEVLDAATPRSEPA